MRERALAAAARGDDERAANEFAAAVSAFPQDAALMNSAGNFHVGAGRLEQALALFEAALTIAPHHGEAAINKAVVLSRLARSDDALALLRDNETRLADLPRYWTARAAAEIAMGDRDGASTSYDICLTREPRNARALSGRAQMALQRGESIAVAAHDRALAISPGDPRLLLGLAEALDAAGDHDEAMRISSALATQLPGWIDGMEMHATLRWAAGDRDRFCDHYAAAIKGADVPFMQSWATMLAGVDRPAAAADVIAQARWTDPQNSDLALAEAVYRGEAGDDVRAGTIFAAHADDTPRWRIAEARHRLRMADPMAAEALLAAALVDLPSDVDAWSLRDLCWRLTEDPRHHWLHGQDGLIRELPLSLSDHEMDEIRALLNGLHDRAAMPIGQSVKQGSQTRGGLFHRREPAVRALSGAIDDAIARYRSGLPPLDQTHPLLRHRDSRWGIAGSWSIRLRGEGHHAPHIHPQGVLSSAAYMVVPDAVRDHARSGWLELGCPPKASKVDLPPQSMIKPREGYCVLFPSTMFHGTRVIATGIRMSVAFDVNHRS